MATSRLEILCATMGQTDFSKLQEMKIQCDVVFANQSDRFSYEERTWDGHTAKLLTTPTLGVGKNRNLALALATGELLLFADDDMEYVEGAPDGVAEAFDRLPAADVILFGTHYSRHGAVYRTRQPKTGRLPVYRALRYGTYAIAIRRAALMKYGLRFSELFGGGCLYSHGEDSDFILQCYRKGLSVYSCGFIIGTTKKDTSTCFHGYSPQFFYDKGALARHSFGLLAIPYMAYIAGKAEYPSELSWLGKWRCLWNGYRRFPSLQSYDSWAAESAGRERGAPP
ncbi:MAG: glycosyltransferase [Clostridiales bacterium]|nr:glycosyltransferase [Clostridiales bacterium]